MVSIASSIAAAPASAPYGRIAFHHSLAWRLILPIPLIVLAGIVVLWFVVPRMIIDDATAEAVRTSSQRAGRDSR